MEIFLCRTQHYTFNKNGKLPIRQKVLKSVLQMQLIKPQGNVYINFPKSLNKEWFPLVSGCQELLKMLLSYVPILLTQPPIFYPECSLANIGRICRSYHQKMQFLILFNQKSPLKFIENASNNNKYTINHIHLSQSLVTLML